MARMNPKSVTRSELALFLPTHPLRVAFEQLLRQVAEVIPDDVDDSQTVANISLDTAARASANASKALLGVLELAATGAAARSEASRIAHLERRVKELEEAPARRYETAISDLRRQVAELQALTQGA